MNNLYKFLKEENSSLQIHRITDDEFREYGEVIHDVDVTELTCKANNIAKPKTGVEYSPSVTEFESDKLAHSLKNECFGETDIQIGYCHGFNSQMNALEWHKSSEINIAVTPLVLILGKAQDIRDGRYDSSKVKAFFLDQGDIIEIYATTLHFCPCQASTSGFGCIVVLPSGTNLPLENEPADPHLFKKNKWLIAHEENLSLINRGVKKGIYGLNHIIRIKTNNN